MSNDDNIKHLVRVALLGENTLGMLLYGSEPETPELLLDRILGLDRQRLAAVVFNAAIDDLRMQYDWQQMPDDPFAQLFKLLDSMPRQKGQQ